MEEKNRYFIELAYDGTKYCGWQKQKNGISVQSVIEEKISIKLKDKVELTGAGRTDSGVHAEFYVAHFDCSKIISVDFINEINKFLPNDITIYKIYKVSNDLHARFSAISRTYKYKIATFKNPFLYNYTYYYSGSLNIDKMNKAASKLLKHSDFTSFCKLHSNNKTNICKVTHAEWSLDNKVLIFTITADRFLRNMVRSVVGTLLDVGRGKLTLKEFENIILSKDRQKASTSVPAKGLFLYDVKYDS